MTEAPVTPQDKPLKKSQLNSLLKKSGKVDSHAVNRGIKAMAKTIANRDLSDEEVMQFAFQIATEKLAALGWPIESIIEESNDEEDLQPATDGPETASPAAGKPDGVPVVDIPVDADLSGSDDPSLSDSTGRNVVELPRNGRPKLSFKFVSPDDDDQEETYQGYGGDIEQETYSEPTQADFDAALENL
ncbi:hypothetical protein J8988_06595 [Klebsiella quasipneumoniae subsp. quasipneumoniae]|uniref:hypothetical protein n=2 Tax=Enterobacteriaceae TaxID=543 RepID=UPI002F969784